jgi:hypothetical protein
MRAVLVPSSSATRIDKDLQWYDALRQAASADAAVDITLAERYFLRALRLADGNHEKASTRGRYASFLLRRGHTMRAITLLDGWLRDEAGADLWRPVELICSRETEKSAMRYLRHLRPERALHPWSLMSYSQVLSQHKQYRVSIYLLKRLIRECEDCGERVDAWRAMGQLGRVYDEAGLGAKAERVWAKAFWAGSANRVLAKRYTWYLERKCDFRECLRVTEEALTRISDPSVLRVLERRRKRVRLKLAG